MTVEPTGSAAVVRQIQQQQPAASQPSAAANTTAAPAPEDSNPVHKGFLGSHIDCQI